MVSVNPTAAEFAGEEEPVPREASRMQLDSRTMGAFKSGMYKGNLSQRAKQRALANGELVRLLTGVYVWRWADGFEVGKTLQIHRPKWVLTGLSACQQRSGNKLSLPVHFAAPRGTRPKRNHYLEVRPTRQLQATREGRFFCQLPLLAVAALPKEKAITVLENAYGGPFGVDALNAHQRSIGALPKRVEEALAQAALGCDSEPEKSLTKALREAGFQVHNNLPICGYRFDIVLKQAKVAVEVDGFLFHAHESRPNFAHDRWKAYAATLRGWTVLRFSASCINYHLERVVESIEVAAGRRQFEDSRVAEPVWDWHQYYAPHRPSLKQTG